MAQAGETWTIRTQEGTRGDLLDRTVMALFFGFIAPWIVYALTYEKLGETPYRVAQVLYAGAMTVAALMYSRRHHLGLSGIAQFIAVFLVINMSANLATGMFQNRSDVDPPTLIQTTFLFLMTFLGFDLMARRHTFTEFCRIAAPLAMVLLVVSAIHVKFFATLLWGRAMYFGMQPNLGGELIFGALAVITCHRNIAFRVFGYALGLYALLVLQSRAAEIAAVLLIAGCETPRTPKAWMIGSVAGLCAVVMVCIALLVNKEIADKVIDVVNNDILRVNDPYRGNGTGFVGRADTWVMAFEKMAQRPLFGTGLNQSGYTLQKIQIHNGYIKNMAEFGVPGAIMNVVIIWGALSALRKDWARGVVATACLVLFFFNARTISMNLFPLLFWIAILPWRAPESSMQRA